MTHPAANAAGRSLLLARTAATVLPAAELGNSIVGFQSRDLRARPFFLLRAQISKLAGAGMRRIGITSPLPQVGKTFVACNLAAAISRLPDLACHLVDLDLRRGSVATTFGLQPTAGTTEYLLGQAPDLASLSWGIAGQKLIVYPAVGRMIRSSEILARKEFSDLVTAFDDARDAAAMGIFDLPPAFANDDAIVAVEQLDGYLLVVQDGVTTAKQVKDAIRLLGKDKLIGTVLNHFIRGLAIDDYGYGYGGDRKFGKYYANR